MGSSQSEDVRYTIGELAKRTGLTVKAIRFYANQDIVPPTGRSPAGHRQYSAEARARLELVRVLRSLGIDLRTVREILDKEIAVAEVAANQADAVEARIHALRQQHAALKSLTEIPDLPSQLGLRPGIAQSLTPHLPATPSAQQLEAWLELTELVRDKDFRAAMRRLGEHYADRPLEPDAVALVRDHADLSLDPASPQAYALATSIVPADRGHEVEIAADPRRDRYMHLLAIINGWQQPEPVVPAVTWYIQTLRAHQS
ncbi:MerR family transcriptional regulator [Kibdelosporangium phytohabitans]|uniref:HTH merR-type domain-containing protein n=1 Tax=Kibdelosporangium phytohabitans TaxID=860235 RepID=A0A0N9I4R6_9PSEU|nr:MerR family transcriptional regulator [Kibdelosporangium phytohabitans]ALG13761.1 hypothetical protein AOZ06_49020 [Kibdelosporangium phytohabitans]MBE1467327.1 DNA-binding transcriptional MerR regulator [Kibdelosporangium phytohabitans]